MHGRQNIRRKEEEEKERKEKRKIHLEFYGKLKEWRQFALV